MMENASAILEQGSFPILKWTIEGNDGSEVVSFDMVSASVATPFVAISHVC